MFLSASSCGPYFLDGTDDIEKNSQLCSSALSLFPWGQSYSEFKKNSNISKMLCFSDIDAVVLKESFTESLLSGANIKFEPSLEND